MLAAVSEPIPLVWLPLPAVKRGRRPPRPSKRLVMLATGPVLRRFRSFPSGEAALPAGSGCQRAEDAGDRHAGGYSTLRLARALPALPLRLVWPA